MRKLYTALAAIAISATGAHAQQQPLKLSLQECIDYALKNSYTMKNAHLDVLIQQEQVKQTTSAAYPHISGKADLVHFSKNHPQYSFFDVSAFNNSLPKGTIGPLPFTIPYTASGSITLSQVLFDGSLIVALQAGNTVMEMARNTENITAENVRYNIYKAYNTLVIAHKQKEVLNKSLVLVRNMQQDLVKTKEAGFAEKIDVERSSVQLNNLATDSIKANSALIVAEQALKYALGLDINAPIILTDTLSEKNGGATLALMAEQENYERVPEYAALITALKLNEYNLKRYKLSALPTLAGFTSRGANFGAANFGDVFKFNDYIEYYNAGLSLTVPIFNGFMRTHQVREAKLNIEKTKNNIDNLKQTINFQAVSARTTLKNSLLQVQSQRRNLELANSVLDLAQRKYKAGVGSNLEVTSAQTDLLMAQNNYFTAMVDVINAEADLRKALGLLK